MKIKNVSFLFFLIWTLSLSGQKITALQFQFGTIIDNYKVEQILDNSIYGSDIPNLNSWGFSLGLLGELAITNKRSLVFGIETSRVNYATLADYRVGYGVNVSVDGEITTIYPAFLKSIQFDLVSIPISWRHYFLVNSKIQPYFGVGASVDMVYQKREKWRYSPYGPFVQIPLRYNELIDYHSSKKGFNHFRSEVNFQLGSSFYFNEYFSFNLHLQTSLFEHRLEQASEIADWIPVFWEKGLYFFNRFSVRFGLQRNF